MAQQHEEVTCNVTYDLSRLDGKARVWRPAWRDTSISVSVAMKVTAFDKRLCEEVVKCLRKDVALMKQMQQQRPLVTYEVDILFDHCGEIFLTPTFDEDHEFETMGDLFLDTSADDLALDVRVDIDCQPRPRNKKEQPPFGFNRKRKLLPTDLVVELNSLNADRWKYKYVHLGHLKPGKMTEPSGYTNDKKSYVPNSNDTVCDRPAVDAWLTSANYVYVENALIGYWHQAAATAENFRLITVKSWSFDSYRIGNIIDNFEEYKSRPNDPNVQYRPPFRNATSSNDLYKRVRRHLETMKGESALVPFMPSHTMNRFNPDKLKTGAGVQEVDIVVRYGSHIDVKHQGRDPVTWLPYNAQWTIDENVTPRALTSAIYRALLKHSANRHLAPEDEAAIKKLFSAELGGKWELQLWILPQGFRKMYRYPDPEIPDTRGLGYFLNERMVADGGEAARALYVEAHIIEKPVEEEGAEGEEVADAESERGADDDEAGEGSDQQPAGAEPDGSEGAKDDFDDEDYEDASPRKGQDGTGRKRKRRSEPDEEDVGPRKGRDGTSRKRKRRSDGDEDENVSPRKGRNGTSRKRKRRNEDEEGALEDASAGKGQNGTGEKRKRRYIDDEDDAGDEDYEDASQKKGPKGTTKKKRSSENDGDDIEDANSKKTSKAGMKKKRRIEDDGNDVQGEQNENVSAEKRKIAGRKRKRTSEGDEDVVQDEEDEDVSLRNGKKRSKNRKRTGEDDEKVAEGEQDEDVIPKGQNRTSMKEKRRTEEDGGDDMGDGVPEDARPKKRKRSSRKKKRRNENDEAGIEDEGPEDVSPKKRRSGKSKRGKRGERKVARGQ